MPPNFSHEPRHRGKKRPASCSNCGSKNTAFRLLYRMRWFRRWRGRVKLYCRDCGKKWVVLYP